MLCVILISEVRDALSFRIMKGSTVLFFLLHFKAESRRTTRSTSQEHVSVAAAAAGSELGLGVHLDGRGCRDRLRRRRLCHHIRPHPVNAYDVGRALNSSN